MSSSLNISNLRLIVYLIYTQSAYTQKSVISNWMFYVMCEQSLLIIAENRAEDDTNKRQRENVLLSWYCCPDFCRKLWNSARIFSEVMMLKCPSRAIICNNSSVILCVGKAITNGKFQILKSHFNGIILHVTNCRSFFLLWKFSLQLPFVWCYAFVFQILNYRLITTGQTLLISVSR